MKDQLVQELKEAIIEALNLEEIQPDDIDPATPLFREGLGLGLDRRARDHHHSRQEIRHQAGESRRIESHFLLDRHVGRFRGEKPHEIAAMRIAVSGIGVISAIGNGAEENLRALRAVGAAWAP